MDIFTIKDNRYSRDFRPLSGIMFSIVKRTILIDAAIIVSVPSRGLCFQSAQSEISKIERGKKVSVPSRGLCFQSTMILALPISVSVFPSPLGDYVFNQEKNKTNRRKWQCFRPLSGIMFSITKSPGHTPTWHISFPSPLGDYVFNQKRRLMLVSWFRFRFRPLSGIMFSIESGNTCPRRI